MIFLYVCIRSKLTLAKSIRLYRLNSRIAKKKIIDKRGQDKFVFFSFLLIHYTVKISSIHYLLTQETCMNSTVDCIVHRQLQNFYSYNIIIFFINICSFIYFDFTFQILYSSEINEFVLHRENLI